MKEQPDSQFRSIFWKQVEKLDEECDSRLELPPLHSQLCSELDNRLSRLLYDRLGWVDRK